MSLAEIIVAVPRPTRPGGGIDGSTALIVIIVVVAVLAVVAIFGWRAPDRSPGADTKKKRDRIED